jgi:hypothetical protein
MPEITIPISEKLHKYLERYFSHEKTLAERFFVALSEGTIHPVGKGFSLSANASIRLDYDTTRDEKAEREEFLERHREPDDSYYDLN